MDKFSNDFNKKIIPLIDKMYQMYQFIGMSKGTFRDFIIDGIGVYTFDEDKEISFHDFYTKAMMEVIHQYIKDTLENKDYKILINFINMTWTDADIKKSISYKKALSGLKRLNTFLDSLDFTLEASEVDSLISTNPKLQAVMKTITDHDKEIIASSDFSKYDNITGMLVEAYCVENGLGSQDGKEDINDIDLELDDSIPFSATGTDGDMEEEADFSWEEEDRKIANVRVTSVSDSSSMEYYYRLIRENPVLKPDEEKALLEAMRKGSSAAKDKLVYSNLRLVAFIAAKYVGRGVPFDDLFQEGVVGLSNGIKRFDLTKGNKLSTYTTWWIRQAISRYVGDNGKNIRIPIHMIEKLGKLERTIRTLTVEYGRSPQVDEIARKMKLDESEVLELYSYRKDTVSLNGKVGDEDDTELGAFVADPNGSLEAAHLSPSMAELIELAKDAGLSERELDILLHHVAYQDVTLEDLGQKYDITRERIRQIEAKALKKLAKCRRTEGLAVYTDNPDASLEFLRSFRKRGPVRSNDTNSNMDQIRNTIREEIKKGSDTQQETSGLEPPEKSDAMAETKTTSSVPVENVSTEKRKKCSKTATIFERAGVSPVDYYKYIEPQLYDYDKIIIEKMYGKDLENPDFSLELTRREKYIFNTTILGRVKRMANDVKIFGEVQPRRAKIKKTIFERVGVSPADYYQYIEPRLTEKDRILMKARYGEDLENPDQSLKSDHRDNGAFTSLVTKLKKWAVEAGLIESSHRDKKNETIKNTEPSSLTASTDVSVECEENNHGVVETVVLGDKKNGIAQDSALVLNRTSVQEEIDGQRKKEEKMAKQKVKTIFEYLGVSPADYYQYIESQLTENDKTLIKMRYGEDLEHPDQSIVFSKEQANVFYGGLVPRMKRIAVKAGLIDDSCKNEDRERKRAGRKDTKTVFELVGVSSADYYQYIEPWLTEKDKTLIRERYGEDLGHPDHSLNFSRKQYTAFYNGVVRKMRRIATREGLIESVVETNPASDVASAGISVQEEVHVETVETVTETESDVPTLKKPDEMDNMEAADGEVLELVTDTPVGGQDPLEATADESLESESKKDVSGTVIAEPQIDKNAAVEEPQLVDDNTVTLESRVEDETFIKKDDTALVPPVEREATVLTEMPDDFSSENENPAFMSEAQLDVYLQFLAGECIEIERRISEKRSKLDDAISLYERRERLLAREKELDKEIASKLNNLHPAKEKVR